MPQPMLQSALEMRIKGEFNEMPGLCLTLAQAQRLWGLDNATCTEALSHLAGEGFLRRSAEGLYVRHDTSGKSAA